jgi:pyridoxine 5-phosphate synthase
MRLSIHLNPFAYTSRIGGTGSVSLLQAAVASDLAGADVLVLRLDEHGFVTARDVSQIRSATSTHVSLEIESGTESVKAALELKPNQVTFVPPIDSDEGLDTASMGGEAKEAIRSFQASEIEVAALLHPNLSLLKEFRRMGGNFVVLDASALSAATDSRETLEAFEAIESAAIAASKLGLGVLAQGALDHRTAALLQTLGTIEELVLDQKLFARAFMLGLDRAFSEYRSVAVAGEKRGS